jgi:hypothetical protein
MRAYVVASSAIGAMLFIQLIGACGDSLEVNPTPPASENDAAPEAGPRCVDKTLFVSASNGNDGNDGCSSDKPLKTISAAIGRAKTNGATDHQAKVCAGVYPEPIILDHPLTIRGGYDCFNWKRAENFGYPNLPSNPETKIEVTTGDVAFAIKSTAITRAVEVEGLTINGPASALAITNGATPVIQHCVVRGNGTGILIEDASPQLMKSKISAGSVALEIKKATLKAAASETGLSDLEISAFQEANTTWAGIRVNDGSDVEITDTRIKGGIVACPANTDCNSIGVHALSRTKVRIERARIAAGEIRNPNAKSRTVAVYGRESEMNLINNMLHSGSFGYVEMPETQAVVLDSCPSPRVFNNTLFATGSSLRGGAIFLAGSTTDAIVQNNILGSVRGNGIAFIFDRCLNTITSFENNAGVNVRGAALSVCATGGNDIELLLISQFQGSQPRFKNNVSLVQPCAPAPFLDANSCSKCASTDTCVTELIANFNPEKSDSGITALFSPDGWKLLPSATCRIAKASPPLNTADKDAFGTLRLTPFSIGAHEQELCNP